MKAKTKAVSSEKPLHPKAQEYLESIASNFGLEQHHLALLHRAAKALSTCYDMDAIIDDEGAILTDRFGQRIPHPASKVRNDNAALFVRLNRELGLDAALPDEPRPPSAPANAHRRR